jgi:hypothetical protein
VTSVADVLEREMQPTINEWLRQVNLLPALTSISLSDVERTGHLHKLYSDLISRLRLPKGTARAPSVAAAAHGQIRREQGYSSVMLVEESRLFQVATFRTLHLHEAELNREQALSGVMVIADEADAQLAEAMGTLSQ